MYVAGGASRTCIRDRRSDSVSTKELGNALEDLVALLHDVPSASVQRRVHVPTLRSGPEGNETREIDVLISQDVAGYPIRIAFECKNEKDPVGVERIDAFIGKLQDIGIHPSQGIFVSPVGYTSGARRRAQDAGLRLLVMDGLDATRLAAAVNDALLAIVLYVLHVESYSEFAFLPPGDDDAEPWPDDVEISYASVHDVVWRRWIKGTFPTKLGEQAVFLRQPSQSRAVVVDCRIVAYVGSVRGSARQLSLRNAVSTAVERTRLETEFHVPNTVDLTTFATDEELAKFQTATAEQSQLVVHRIRVPRIIAGAVFWPPSQDAVRKVVELRKAGVHVTFADVEGRDLSAAWAHFESQRSRTGEV